jgi:hypothetical protein
MPTEIQHRRDTAANWTADNPTLAAGELGFETDTLKFKIGNGTTGWTSLPYQTHPTVRPTTGAPTVTATDAAGDWAVDVTYKVMYGPLGGPSGSTPLVVSNPWLSCGAVAMPVIPSAAVRFGAFGASVDDPASAAATKQPSGGVLLLARIRAMVTGSVGHIGYAVGTAGATLTTAENWVGIYDTGQTTAGTATLLEQSADQTSIWTSTGAYNTALTAAATVIAGTDYLVAWLSNGTTLPAFVAGSSQNLSNVGLTAASYRFGTYGTAQTTLPASFAMSSIANVAGTPVAVLLA